MTGTNGNVGVEQLYTYQGVPIARVIYPDLAAAAAEIRHSGGSFSIFLPVGGYRSLDIQVDMARHPWPDPKYNLTKGVGLSKPGRSRHGYGKAVDVSSSLKHAAVVAIMAAHGFTQYDAVGDPNHFAWGNELTAAGAGRGRPIIDTPTEDMDMITRRLVRQNGTPGVYYAVNNVLSPVISEQHLAGIQADLLGLRTAGDPFLVQAGDSATVTAVTVVDDLRAAGILPATGADLAGIDFDPSQADIEKITAAVVAAAPQGEEPLDPDEAILRAISRMDDAALAAFGLARLDADR